MNSVLCVLSFEDVDNRIRSSLEEQGFGVLTEIDVKNTLKKKLDKDFQKSIEGLEITAV